MLRLRTAILVFPAAFLLAGSLAAADPLVVLRRPDGAPERYAGSVVEGKVLIPQYYRPKAAEMRGVWIATVENIDFPKQPTTAGFQAAVRSMFQKLRARRFNAVFFQVRPCNDAFYPSHFNPYSKFLSGKEGVPPAGAGDPLAIAVREAHAQGMEFHAWLNPYRVVNRTKLSKLRYLDTLAPGNFARRNPHLVLDAPLPDGGRLLFLNPGEPEVVRHVARTVREIADRYRVDGIVFDDYFYPYTDIGSIDARTYVRNNPHRLSRQDWRTANITMLIREVRRTLDEHQRKSGRKVAFGISPFGIWANRKDRPEGSWTAGKSSLLVQHADTRDWVKKQYIDYIIPQLYWPFCHDKAAYAALADWWAAQVRGTRVRLYIGMSPYRLGERQWETPQELFNQLRYNLKHPEIKGQVFYSCRSVLQPGSAAMKSAMDRLPKFYWRTHVPVQPPPARYPQFR